MIDKFVSIKNIGCFHHCCPTGNVTLRSLNLIFAPNGRGKTTLCAILRSMQTGQPEFIEERATLGADGHPFAQIKVSGALITFTKNAWSAQRIPIAIFDSVFIHENVYAGDYVDSAHRKNLYRVIIGRQGIELAERIDKLDNDIRELNADIKAKKDAVSKTLPSGMSLEAYLAWERVHDIDVQIEKKKNELAKLQRALDQAVRIRSKPPLAKVKLPELPADFLTVLGQHLADVAADAEQRVHDHIAAHQMGDQGETWLSQGLGHITDSQCPFCGQPVEANKLIDAYRSYFNAAYAALKDDVAQLSGRVTAAVGNEALKPLQQTLSANLNLMEFWREFTDTSLPACSFENAEASYATLTRLAFALAKRKQLSPTEPVLPDAEFNTAMREVRSLRTGAKLYNDAVEATNARITQQKAALEQSPTINTLRQELDGIEARKKRFDPEVVSACQEYQSAERAKAGLDEEKKRAREQLDQYCVTVIESYQKAINDYLEQFGAGFRIVNSRHDYRGGTPRSLFQLEINNTPVDLGDPDTRLGTPCFKTTLSAGDRSALALAFFLAHLRTDPTVLAGQVVVLDDPFTSQDAFRRQCTAELLVKLATEANQVIVLSHDPSFLKLVRDSAPCLLPKELQAMKAGSGSTIAEWSADEAAKTQYLKDYDTLVRYRRDRSPTTDRVARAIRPFLEELYRARFPAKFLPKDWLGDFIQKIESAPPDDGLVQAKPDLDELRAINEYSKRFLHAGPPVIDPDELDAYVARTLKLVGGY